MAKIVTLKNTNDEEVYPVTTAEAVNGGLYADNGTEVTGVVPDVTTSRIEDGAVTSDKIDWTTLPIFYKACPTVNPLNIPSAWTGVIPSGWSMTFDAEIGAVYKVEIATSYLCWNGASAAEVDLQMDTTNSTRISTASGIATGTFGGGVSFGRMASCIIRATATSVAVSASVSVGTTGNLARIDAGHIFVMRIA